MQRRFCLWRVVLDGLVSPSPGTHQEAFMIQGYDILYKDKTRMRSTCNSTSRAGSISFIGLALTFATLYCVIFGTSFDRIRELVGGQVTVMEVMSIYITSKTIN